MCTIYFFKLKIMDAIVYSINVQKENSKERGAVEYCKTSWTDKISSEQVLRTIKAK